LAKLITVVLSFSAMGRPYLAQLRLAFRRGGFAVGFAVGLFAPPLLAATAVGAAMGAAGGGLLHHEVAGKLGEQARETIPLGGAGLIVAYSHSEAKIAPSVTLAVQKTVGEAEGSHVQALKRGDWPTLSRRWPKGTPDMSARGHHVKLGARRLERSRGRAGPRSGSWAAPS